MNILSFGSRFPNEQSCRNYLKKKREQEGITCKNCGCKKHYWFGSKELWKCSECGSWTNLRAGTIMMKSKISVRTWFMCIHLMTSTKKSISALEMQRQLGMKRYEPVWFMMQKIRRSMGKRDSRYKLKGNIEVDDSFFEIVDLEIPIEETELKRGRGSYKQKKVLVMVESTVNPKQINPHKKKRIMGFVKMVTIDELTAVGINYELQKSVEKTSTVWTDAYHSFASVNKVVAKHIKDVTPSKEAHEKLPWVHAMISNAKRQFLGVHHSIGKNYLQNYLNEFYYKLNRRTFETDLFDRMIVAGASDTWF
jgi:ISXO2-like transposase domain/Transposase zinc-ribbon domain